MNHDHSHSHSHTHSHEGHTHHVPQSFNFAFSLAISLNLIFTLFQMTYAFESHSMSLLADALHNFGDVFGLLLAWGANWLLTRPARKRYSYGFKRTTILAALGNALILASTSALILYESLYKLFHLTEINEWTVIIVAFIGIFINAGTALLFMRGAHEDLNIKGAFLHLIYDALISFGVVISALVIYFTQWRWLDPLIGIVIVGIVLWGTWGLLRSSVSLLLDAVPRHIDHKGIKHYLLNLEGVTAVHDLHIWGLSTKEVALTAHLIMPTLKLSDAKFEEINIALKKEFRINHATLQVESGDLLCELNETCL